MIETDSGFKQIGQIVVRYNLFGSLLFAG